MEHIERSFKGLADTTRILCVGLLLEFEELCVCEIEGALGITQSKTSRHLRYLVWSGFLTSRRQGIWIHYRLNSHLSVEQRQLTEVIRGQLKHAPFPELIQKIQNSVAAKKTNSTNPCNSLEV